MSNSTRDSDLGIFLSASVPLRIMTMLDSEDGAPTKEQIARARKAVVDLGERGDVMLFGGGKPGEAATLANEVAHMVAILAFAPGGVTLFGQTFQAKKT